MEVFLFFATLQLYLFYKHQEITSSLKTDMQLCELVDYLVERKDKLTIEWTATRIRLSIHAGRNASTVSHSFSYRPAHCELLPPDKAIWMTQKSQMKVGAAKLIVC